MGSKGMRELGFSAVMTGAQGLAEAVREFRFWNGLRHLRGYRLTGLEGIGAELASGMGFPPLLKTMGHYQSFSYMSSF